MIKIIANLLVEQVNSAFWLLDGTMEGAESKHIHFQPQGKAVPVGATYIHVLVGADMVVNSMFNHQKTLFDTTFKSKTGADLPYPSQKDGHEALDTWNKKVKVDVEKAKAYRTVVQELVTNYLKDKSDEELSATLDLSEMGLGKQTYAWVISNFIIGHIYTHVGEISSVKGLQDLKGYPF